MSVRRLADPSVQPADFVFTRANRSWAKEVIKKYPKGRENSAIIPLLMRAQEQEGWVTKAAIEHVADMIGMPYIRALEVATFYTQFQLQPVGTRAHVQVCGTTPCMLRGAGDLIDLCKSKIHPEPLHTNAEGTLSWEEVECQGACVNAPMIMIFKDTYEDLAPERLSEIIDAFERGEGASVPVGPQNGRMSSEPMGGPTTLVDEVAATADGGGKQPAARAPTRTQVPPSRAGRPKTFAPETSQAIRSPSPAKSGTAEEKAQSVSDPAENEQAADQAAEAVEKTVKQRRRSNDKSGPAAAYKAPEKLQGEPVGEAGRKRRSERKPEPGKPMPESPDGAARFRPRKPGASKKDEGQ